MSDAIDEPDWSHLPRDPIAFFGLAAGFDRTDLKRRYGQLIRRFKPEQQPVEFQRIRAAYEELENWLRFRPAEEPAQQVQPQPTSGWTTISTDSPAVPVERLFTAVHARLAREQPEEIYRELAVLPKKTTDDYFALAVLSDVVTTASEDRFIDWVLQGLGEYPACSEFHYLLQFYLRGTVPANSLPRLLIGASQHIPEHYYFPQTERHWITLLRTHGFACFRDTLAECERRQPGKDISNRVIFYVHILRSAIWEADAAWVTQTLSFVEEHFRYIPPGIDGDIDLLLELQSYVKSRARFVERHHLRREMDSILRTYIAEGEVKGDSAMRVLQKKLLDEPQTLVDAFPDFDEPTLGQFYSLWSWISLDSVRRNIGEIIHAPVDPVWDEAGRQLTRRASRLANWSIFGLKWQLKKIGLISLMVITFLAIPTLLVLAAIVSSLAFPRNQQDQAIALTSLASMGIGIFLAFRFWKFATKKWVSRIDVEAWPQCYRLHWQREVLQFLKRTMLPVEDVTRLITVTSFMKVREHLNRFIARDYVLAFYSLAQRFIA